MSKPCLSWTVWRLEAPSGLLCHPCVHAQPLDRGALPVLGASRGSGQPQRGVEVWPVVLAIAAVVRAARGAEAVSGGASQNFLSARALL